jgi:hypothetical protein
MMPLTAATHFWAIADTHRVDASLAAQNDRVPCRRQSNLELFKENKFSNQRCALRQQRCHNAIEPFSCPTLIARGEVGNSISRKIAIELKPNRYPLRAKTL